MVEGRRGRGRGRDKDGWFVVEKEDEKDGDRRPPGCGPKVISHGEGDRGPGTREVVWGLGGIRE